MVGNGRPTIRKSVPIGPPYYRDAGEVTVAHISASDSVTHCARYKFIYCTVCIVKAHKMLKA